MWKWQNNVWSLAVDTQIKINIEEPEKAKKLTDAQYFKGFLKLSPLQQH